MTSSLVPVRAVLAYALILPTALLMGYLLATPGELGTWATVGMVVLVISAPIVLANHHAVLFLTWNMTAVAFFLPGRPQWWLVMAFMSLFISLFQRALSKEIRFISVPSLIWPLLYLAFVVYMTAHLTGGFGLRILGSGNIGGKRYISLFAGIAGFLAMCAHRIPFEKAGRYAGLYFLGSIPNAVGSVIPLLGPAFYFLLLFFPFEPWVGAQTGFREGILRYSGVTAASVGAFFYLLARYGPKEVLNLRRPVRPLMLLGMLALASGGGFRSDLAFLLLTFCAVFCLEGLLWTRYSAMLFAGALLFCLAMIPLTDKLPLSVQRTLSFLPLNVNPIARFDAQASTEWRVQMWQAVLPRVPQYFWLGKGLGISSAELDLTGEMARVGRVSSQEVAILAGDYHNGMLSVVIPFGIWGVIGLLWFWIAGQRALYLNYKNGAEALKRLNALLFALFISRVICFVFVYGTFYDDLASFTGILGLSVAVNHGIRKPAPAPAAATCAPIADSQSSIPTAPAFARLA